MNEMRMRGHQRRRRRWRRLPFFQKRGARESANEWGTGGGKQSKARKQHIKVSFDAKKLWTKRHGWRQRRSQRADLGAASKLQSPPLSVVLGRNRKTRKREKAPAWRSARLWYWMVPMDCRAWRGTYWCYRFDVSGEKDRWTG